MPDNTTIVDLSKITIERAAINKVSASTARFYNVIPVKIEKDSVLVASHDPSNTKLADDLRFVSGLNIRMVTAKIAVVNKTNLFFIFIFIFLKGFQR